MATELFLIKTAGGTLAPADPYAAEYVAKVKLGGVVRATVVQPRNVKFLRKFFALLDVAFDAWEPEQLTYKGQVVAKEREQFRNDVTVLAGYYESSINLRGEVRLTAKSISFASMDEEEFSELYNAAINVILAKILTNYSRDDLDNVVENVLRFG